MSGPVYLLADDPLCDVVAHMLRCRQEFGWRYAGWVGHGSSVTVHFDTPTSPRLRVVERAEMPALLGEDLEIPEWAE